MLLGNLTKSTCSSRNLVLTTLVLIEAIAVYNWVVAPHTNYLLAAQRYESVAGELAKKNQIISNNVPIKEKELKDLKEEFERIHTRLFDPAEARKFFSDVQTMLKKASYVTYSLDFSPADSAPASNLSEADSFITANRARLSVVGNFGNIVALMNKLQDGLKQVWINPVSIKSIGGSSGHLKCDATITVYVIHNKEKPPHG